MKQDNRAVPLSVKEVSITGHFWKDFMEKARTKVIPYQWEALNDRIPDAEPSCCMQNFRVASGKEKGEYAGGRIFQDSDVAKWLEAVAYSLMWHPDPELEKTADGAIDEIVAAQQPDGYLNTYYIITDLNKRFTNLKSNHELYCLGHLLEAGVAYYQATGKNKLLNALIKYVDLVDSLFGPEDYKQQGYPGHQEIELALVKLYDITGDEKHLKLAKYFLDERGKEPLYFRNEIEKHGNVFRWKDSLFQFDYYQAGTTIDKQEHAVGHAVRAAYMYAGMVDVARKTGDAALMESCYRLWKDVTRRQMYVTGAIGSSFYGESFTFEYDLPNDRAYAETCASIALAFFAQRMFNYEPKAEYIDVMEQALYNSVISGMSVDGTKFFYVNPLEVIPIASEKDQLRRHVKVERQKWFACACCPPNLARILTSLGSYAYSKNADTFYINLFVEGSVDTQLQSGEFGLETTTEYPWNGNMKFKVTKVPKSAEVAVRIPGWCTNYSLKHNSGSARYVLKDGYAIFSDLSAGDTIELALDMPVMVLESNPRVRENIGKVAVQRGPVVYCIEEADNGKDLHRVFVAANAKFTDSYNADFFGGAVLLQSPAKRLDQSPWDPDTLYQKANSTQYEDITLKWVPYYLWANRGVGEMATWIHTQA